MTVSTLARLFQYSLVATLLAGISPAALAQTSHPHDNASTPPDLLQAVRDATAKYQDVAAAEADDYHLLFGCVSGPDSGAMGLHYVNLNLVVKGVVDVNHPQIIIYEPQPNGRPKLIGADFLVFKADWDNSHPPGTGAPQLMGQLFHEFDAPNRFGLDSFYTLHVWAWKENPTGAFVNWHQNVSCQSFTGP